MLRVSTFLALNLLYLFSVATAGGQDSRPLRDLNSYFPFEAPSQAGDWEGRKAEVRRHLQVALGLWPMPSKTPLRTVIHGRMEFEEYSIEKVYFESMPGFHVTGNLYRPRNNNSIRNGQRPAILCPHGHWSQGRFLKFDDDVIEKEIAQGAEKFKNNARSVLQARCAHLAKMGCVVFHYDMIGYADCQQIKDDVAHRYARQRADMINPKSWGLFSPQAESNLQSVMGLQTWNSIRSIDFLESLPDVDPTRIAVTGASGGGTQTFVLCALDDRPAACCPAVMVSTAMQGGCTCENACYLRIGTGNVEFAALFAPKPMLLTAANDWTREMEQKGFPEIRKVYDLYGKPELVQLTSRTEFGHNYNQVCRESMYRFFANHLDLDGPLVESEITFVEPELLSVYDDEHPRPAGGPEFERQLLKWWYEDTRSQLTSMVESNSPPATVSRFGQFAGAAWQSLMNSAKSYDGGNWRLSEGDESAPDYHQFVCENTHQEQLTIAGKINYRSPTALVFATRSGTGIFNQGHPALDGLLASKDYSHFACDLNFIPAGSRQQTRRVQNTRQAAAYTLGYNPPQILRRSFAPGSLLVDEDEGESTEPDQNEELLNSLLLEFSQVPENALAEPVNQLFLIADRSAAPEAAVAIPLVNDYVDGYVIQLDGFRFQDVTDIRHPDFLPGGSKYLDVPGLLALAAPKPILIFGEDERTAAITVAVYKAAGAANRLTFADKDQMNSEFILKWIKSIEPGPR